ncbi:SAICAR synthetase, partial [Tilletiopsis washingtonensis]
MSAAAITTTSLPLPLIARGKVRDLYDAGLQHADVAPEYRDAILFVATDRISAFDVILDNGIPEKGPLLHALSAYWFDLLTPSILPSHLLATSWDAFPRELQQALAPVREQVEGRAMLVKRARVLPIEAIVRGYITGSAWREYQRSGTVHGIAMPAGMQESQAFPEPLFTPSTKAEQGEHDENIHPDKVPGIIGEKLAKAMSEAALALYKKAAAHAQSRGIILADTKFEFGVVKGADGAEQLILVDEVLTPDSSRFWGEEDYKVGTSPSSFDKEFVRSWLKANNKHNAADTGEKVRLPDDVALRTAEKYKEAYARITGRTWQGAAQ